MKISFQYFDKKFFYKIEQVVTEEQIVGAEGTEIQKDRISSPKHLIPPKSDLRPEQRVMSEEAMVDLRKRDRSSLQVSWSSYSY